MADSTRAAADAFASMAALLGLGEPRFTEADREAMKAGCAELAAMCTQMDAGQRGRGVSFDVAPFAFVRVAVAATALCGSGKIDEVACDGD